MSPRRRISTPRFLKISGGGRRTTTLRSIATRISVWGTLLDVTLGTIACVLLLLGLLLLSIVHTRRSRARVKSAAHRRPIPASSTARAQRITSFVSTSPWWRSSPGGRSTSPSTTVRRSDLWRIRELRHWSTEDINLTADIHGDYVVMSKNEMCDFVQQCMQNHHEGLFDWVDFNLYGAFG